jgi:hypothetical protein
MISKQHCIVAFSKTEPKKYINLQKIYINGKWTSSIRGKSFDVINPADETAIKRIDEATHKDTNVAAKAARQAF